MRRIRKKAVLVLSGILLGTGAALGPPASAGEAEPRVRADYTIGQFNMAGGHKEHGPKGNEAPDALVRSVQDRQPVFVALQEACRDWNDRLVERLAPAYDIVFDPVTLGDGRTATCWPPHTAEFGNALLFRKDFGFDTATKVAHALQSPAGYEQREMVCVRAESRKVVACSTHLTVGDDSKSLNARRHEASVARQILATTYAGYTKFLGGDLNDDPLSGALDNFYDPGYQRGARGEFKEVDSPCGNEIKVGHLIPSLPPTWIWCRSGESTHGAGKLDYLLVPPSTHVDWADATHATHSDHDPLWAGVVF
ncbi:endonuclease/exonuclease/phosphatase family protein [Streptomyces longispororuber]|uniref:endonuclease/exonuclease/phosphatase family protein n=1 Tax=Streptomyces longispororuber TaxID=68230 RepID=UPI003701CE82